MVSSYYIPGQLELPDALLRSVTVYASEDLRPYQELGTVQCLPTEPMVPSIRGTSSTTQSGVSSKRACPVRLGEEGLLRVFQSHRCAREPDTWGGVVFANTFLYYDDDGSYLGVEGGSVMRLAVFIGLCLLAGCGDSTGAAGGAGGGGVGGLGGTSGTGGAGGIDLKVWPCTEQGIRDAITFGGGPHTFDCDGPTTVTMEATIEVDNDVILDGEGVLTVDGDESHTVFRVVPSTVTTLRGMTITGGYVPGAGGGIYNEGNLTIEDCRIVENRSDDIGAGVYSFDRTGGEGLLEIRNSEISRNEGVLGAGIFSGSRLRIIDSTVADNVGGGIFSGATLTVRDSTIRGNVTETAGGGIYNVGGAFIGSSVISDNEAQAGGGIYNVGELQVFSSTIEGNAADEGGGIYGFDAERSAGDLVIFALGLIDVSNSTVANNTARLGGGIYSISLRMTAYNSTFSGNTATEEGGALYVGGTTLGASTIFLTSATITDNSAPLGSAIAGAGQTPTVRLAGNVIDGELRQASDAVALESQRLQHREPR